MDHSLFIHIDGSRKLLLTKLIPQILTSRLFGINNHSEVWDRHVQYKNLVKFKSKPCSLQGVYSSHLLEHLYFSDANVLLRTVFEGLVPGGLIRLCLPDYDFMVNKYVSSRINSPINSILVFEESLLSHPLDKPSFYSLLRGFASGQHHVHRWHPTYALVEKMLQDAGFSDIKNMKYHESQIPKIETIETRFADSFYIEAMKPKLI